MNKLCEEPFQDEFSVWPSNYCHGQIFPLNIYYSNKSSEKYFFIDFEPKLVGLGPVAYDLIFLSYIPQIRYQKNV